VLIRGPKGCGKTETGRFHSRSEVEIEDSPRIRAAMAVDPSLLLQGDTPRLIDEWQQEPSLWNTIRHEVDRRRTKGQFILTGSSTPQDEGSMRRHSGVGRFAILTLRTMTWKELGWSTGAVALGDLMAGHPPSVHDDTTSLEELATRLVIGGWPGNLGVSRKNAIASAVNYIELLVEQDVSRAWGIRRDPGKIRRTLQSLARNISTECSMATLAKDAGGPQGRLADETIADYIQTFQALMVEDSLPAWTTHVRSAATLRRQPKRHLADPSLACAALGLGPARLASDLEYMGLVFESAVIHDLRVYAETCGGRLFHYRDSNGIEADAIVELRDGTWAAFEIKLGFGAADQAASSLARFADTVDQAKKGPPAALTVITGSGLAHQRPDGVNVVPLGCLG
jgi:predicted AAA+ superfamily ATPase